jgi:hypothetical protein
MQYLWGMINLLQLITIMALMSINVPGYAAVINKVLIQMASVDLLPSDMMISGLLHEDDNEVESTPFNEYFDTAGLSSTQTIENLGSSFVY